MVVHELMIMLLNLASSHCCQVIVVDGTGLTSVKGAVKPTGMMIIPILCTVVSLLSVVLTSETRRE